MREAVIVEALRTPIARGKLGKGELSGFHADQLLAKIQDGVVERAGIDPKDVEQIVGGCVTQAGEQAGNLARNAWLSRGKGWHTGGTTDRHPVRLGPAGQPHRQRAGAGPAASTSASPAASR